MHDVIVVGARCAGAPTAMLLARAGLDVVLVDRARFPSDTISTHFIHPEGMFRLDRWGVLDRVLAASGAPRIESLHLQLGAAPMALEYAALYPPGFPTPFAYCPRRTAIDGALLQAARDAGVEVREGFRVDGLVHAADGRVTGVRHESAHEVEELRARLIVGADGLHSRIGRLAGARESQRIESAFCAYYSYFAGMEPRSELVLVPGAIVVSFPTDNGEQCVGMAATLDRVQAFRADLDRTAHAFVAEFVPSLAGRLQSAHRKARWLGSVDMPHLCRTATGPGWALAGDAGLYVDPSRGFGITKAFNDAEWLAEAVILGLESGDLDRELERYGRARDRAGDVYTERNLAWVRFALGEVDESVLQLEGPLPLGPLAEWAA